MVSPTPTGRPPTPAQSQLRGDHGATLLALLGGINKDAALSGEHAQLLRYWLAANEDATLPDIHLLGEIVRRVLAAGRVHADERLELQLVLEKVLPVTERGAISIPRESAGTPPVGVPAFLPDAKISRSDLKQMGGDVPPTTTAQPWREQAMTEAQRDFVKALDGTIAPNATRGEASDLISRLLGQKPLSHRQTKLLRFWGREPQSSEGPRHVAAWLDAWYGADPDRNRAWELFEAESAKGRVRGEPDWIPLGAGEEYLARIKRGGAAAQPIVPRKSWRVPAGVWISCLFAIAGIGVAVWFYLGRPHVPWPGATDSATLQPPPPRPGSSGNAAPAAPTAARNNAAYVAALKIGGVIGGGRTTIMIDGALYGAGDVVDASRGLLVMRVDNTTRRVTFVDTEGKTYVRSLE